MNGEKMKFHSLLWFIPIMPSLLINIEYILKFKNIINGCLIGGV